LGEGICLVVFTTHSNPRGFTQEIIRHDKNDLFIQDCENIKLIIELIAKALQNTIDRNNDFNSNTKMIVSTLDGKEVERKTLNAYSAIQ